MPPILWIRVDEMCVPLQIVAYVGCWEQAGAYLMSSLVVPGVMMYASKLRLPFSFTSRTCTGLHLWNTGSSGSVMSQSGSAQAHSQYILRNSCYEGLQTFPAGAES